jgi:hypothetical protein
VGGDGRLMSRTVDDRIVQMTFENRDFEKNANTTLGTLDKLGKALKFDGVSSSLKGLQRTADALDFGIVTDGLQKVSVKFNALTAIGISALNRLTEKAVDAGVKLVKSLSIDQITKSWSKYDELIASEQSIMSAVSNKINPLTKELYNIEDITELIGKLQWYSDETSYSVTQMTNAVSQFTASGVDLNTAIDAIMGISNAAAASGVSTQKAEHAFIGFSKAIGQGYLSLGVWNMQLRTSGITNSEKFKKSILDAAVAVGTLEKVTSGANKGKYRTTKKSAKEGQIFSASDFTSALNAQWATSQVLLRAFGSYSNTINDIYGLVTDGRLNESSKVMKDLTRAAEKQGKTMNEDTLAWLGLNKEFDTASSAINAIEEAYKKLGLTAPKSLEAFRNAQEAISFSQAISATADAVSSKWSQTFELIFGNYEEARKLWTALANEMWVWFAGSGDDRNNALKEWHNGLIKITKDHILLDKTGKKAVTTEGAIIGQETIEELTGYEALMKGLISILEYITTIVETVREAISEVFPPITGTGLLEFTKAFYLFIQRIEPSGEMLDRLSKIVKTIASVFKYFKDIFSLFINNAIKPALGPIKTLYEYFRDLLEPLQDYIISSAEAVSQNTFLIRAFTTIGSIFTKVIGITKRIAERFASFFGDIKEKHGETISKFADIVKESILKLLEWFDGILSGGSFDWVNSIFEIGEKIVSFIVELPNKIKGAFSNLQGTFNKIIEVIGNLLSKLTGGVSDFLTSNSGNWRNLAQTGALAFLLPSLIKLGKTAKKVSGAVSPAMDKLGELTKKLDNDVISNWLKIYLDHEDTSDEGPGFLERLFPSITGKVTKNLEKTGDAIDALTKRASGSTKTFGDIAKGLLILSAAMLVLSKIDSDKAMSSLILMGGLLGEMFLFLKGVSGLTGEGTKINKFFQKMVKNDPTKGLIKIAASMLILAVALRVVSKIPFENMLSGILGIGLLLGEMFAFIYGLSALKIEKVAKGLSSLIAISAALLIVSGAVKILSKIDVRSLVKAIATIGVVLAEFAAFFYVVKNVKSSSIMAIGKSMIEIAASLGIMTIVIKLLGSMNASTIGTALLAIGALLIEIAAFTVITGKVGAAKVLAVATAMLIMAPAFVIFASAIKVLSKIRFGKIIGAVAGIGALLLVLAGFAAIIAATGTTLSFIALSAAMVLMSASILALSGALWVLGNLDWNQLKKGIVAFTAMIVIIGALGIIFGSIVAPIFAFAAALGVLGLALIVFAEGVKLLGVALLQFNIFSDFIAGLRAQLPTVSEEGANLVIDGINTAADVLRTKSGEFGEALGNLAEAIIEGLIKALGGFVAGFGGSLISFIGEGFEAVKNWFTGDKNRELVKTGEDTVVGVKTGVEEKKQDLLDTTEDLKDNMVDSLDGKEEAKGIGEDTLEGLIKGLSDPALLNSIAKKGSAAANIFNNSYRSALDQHSPSRVMQKNGAFTIQGLLDGLNSRLGQVGNAGTQTGKTLADSLTDAISISESMTEDVNPVITPVLDLSKVSSGLASVDSMLNTDRALSLSSRVSRVDRESQNGGNSVNNTTYSPTINVTVNGSKGQNVNQLADVVVNKIQKSLERKASVWQ